MTEGFIKGMVMRAFCGFYRVLFVLIFVMSVGGMACSDDTEKPGKDVEIEEDVSSEDVGDNTDVSSQDVENVEDVAEDVSGNDVGDKLATGEECPERCVLDDMGMLRCNACAGDWCVLDQFTLKGEMPYCTEPCVSNAECDVYGADWICSDFYNFCIKAE